MDGSLFETNFNPDDIPERCPHCPEMPLLGECISETCTGYNEPAYYTKTSVEINCSYANEPEIAFHFDIPTQMYEEEHDTPFTDRCIGPRQLVEYYCHESGALREMEYDCPVACKDGACLHCQDSDGGINPEEAGEILEDALGRQDSCQPGSQLEEYFCGGESVFSVTMDCDYCWDGECVRCEDSDGGFVPAVFGTSFDGSSDICLDGNKLQEFYLFKNENGVCNIEDEEVLCPNGCSEGACNPSCSDGIQNGNETGVDCGGSCPADCRDCFNPLTQSEILLGSFFFMNGKFDIEEPIVWEKAPGCFVRIRFLSAGSRLP